MLTPDYIKRVGRMMEQTSGCEHRDDPAPLPQIAGEQKFGVNNKLFALKAGQKYTLSQNLVLEFVRMQHSIIETVAPVLHTPQGAIVYACDFKLDRTPVIGEPPDFERLRR